MTESVTIILPLPGKRLSPNHSVGSRGGRFAKAAATKKYRSLAENATRAAGITTGPWELARASATFFWKDRRRRDEDNALASLKAAYDGIVDAGLLMDDDREHLRREMPIFEVDPAFPRVEITVTRIES